jgi:Fe-S-cluster containining protein
MCGACCDNERAAKLSKKQGVILGKHFPCFDLIYEKGKRLCGRYEDRPEMCKGWPFIPEDLIDFPECTFKFI